MGELDDQQKFFTDYNDTQIEFRTDLTVANLFEKQAEETPNAIAAVYGKENLSYRELNSRANYLAHRLCALGVESCDVVGLCFEQSLEYLVALFAALKVGATFVPLDASHPDARLLFKIEDTEAKTRFEPFSFRRTFSGLRDPAHIFG